VVNPLDYPLTRGEEVDFELLPFSCPAGRNLLSVGKGPGNTRLFLVVGDEHTVLYSVTTAEKASTPTSTRANAHARRSPQAETTGGIGKKRKSSASGRSVATDTVEHQAHIRPVWRARQGFGTVLG
jgi:DNA damage-binding protein 1